MNSPFTLTLITCHKNFILHVCHLEEIVSTFHLFLYFLIGSISGKDPLVFSLPKSLLSFSANYHRILYLYFLFINWGTWFNWKKTWSGRKKNAPFAKSSDTLKLKLFRLYFVYFTSDVIITNTWEISVRFRLVKTIENVFRSLSLSFLKVIES